jgi:hypothetical protein
MNLREAYPSNFSLETFKKISSFKRKYEYCNERLPYIASGSSRWVFKVDDEKCLKIAKNKKGLAQNEAEYDIGSDGYFSKLSIFAPIYDVDYDPKVDNTQPFFWIEMRLAKKCTASEFFKIEKISFDEFSWLLRNEFGKHNFNILIDSQKKRAEEWKEHSEFWHDLCDYIHNQDDLPIGDLTRIQNYGIIDNHIVLIDYGLTRQVFEKYYY